MWHGVAESLALAAAVTVVAGVHLLLIAFVIYRFIFTSAISTIGNAWQCIAQVAQGGDDAATLVADAALATDDVVEGLVEREAWTRRLVGLKLSADGRRVERLYRQSLGGLARLIRDAPYTKWGWCRMLVFYEVFFFSFVVSVKSVLRYPISSVLAFFFSSFKLSTYASHTYPSLFHLPSSIFHLPSPCCIYHIAHFPLCHLLQKRLCACVCVPPLVPLLARNDVGECTLGWKKVSEKGE